MVHKNQYHLYIFRHQNSDLANRDPSVWNRLQYYSWNTWQALCFFPGKNKEFLIISNYFLCSYSCPKVLHQLHSFSHLKAKHISESQSNKEPIVRDVEVGKLGESPIHMLENFERYFNTVVIHRMFYT